MPQENVQENPPKPPPKPSVKPNIATQAKITKFKDSEEEDFSEDTGYTEPNSTKSETTNDGEVFKKILEEQENSGKELEALLKLAQNPIKASL